MAKKRILIIGLEGPEVQAIKQDLGFEYLFIHWDVLPKVKLIEGELYAESPTRVDTYLLVDKVIFHGIFSDDYDFITLLALWRGPCLPNAQGMMDLRQRIPGLARALQVSRFSGIKRGMVIGSQAYHAPTEAVAKWGLWHCGEDKEKFSGDWTSAETSVIEEFIEGEAVRIMLVGNRYWQIKLAGKTWLKSIHSEEAHEMETDSELLTDSRNIARHFNLNIVGVDYMVAADGSKYLLEVNHIPNVTVFSFVNQAFTQYARNWITDSTPVTEPVTE